MTACVRIAIAFEFWLDFFGGFYLLREGPSVQYTQKSESFNHPEGHSSKISPREKNTSVLFCWRAVLTVKRKIVIAPTQTRLGFGN